MSKSKEKIQRELVRIYKEVSNIRTELLESNKIRHNVEEIEKRFSDTLIAIDVLQKSIDLNDRQWKHKLAKERKNYDDINRPKEESPGEATSRSKLTTSKYSGESSEESRTEDDVEDSWEEDNDESQDEES